jgi:hypothetical protein
MNGGLERQPGVHARCPVAERRRVPSNDATRPVIPLS